MFRPRVIPCLLLKNKGLVKTKKFNNPIYIGDPINAVRIFNAKKADELIFLDIAASKEKRCVNFRLIQQIAHEAYMPLAVGGGILTIKHIHDLLRLGAEKVVISTSAILNPNLIKKASEIFGKQSIVVSINVKRGAMDKYEVYVLGSKKATGLNPVDHAKNMQQLGAGEILINSIDRDGTMKGYDIELVKAVADNVSVPLIACGGAGKLEDLKDAVYSGHASAVAAGSMFVFHGQRRAVLINYPTRKILESIFNKK